jgi:hypothetical protein
MMYPTVREMTQEEFCCFRAHHSPAPRWMDVLNPWLIWQPKRLDAIRTWQSLELAEEEALLLLPVRREWRVVKYSVPSRVFLASSDFLRRNKPVPFSSLLFHFPSYFIYEKW